ncbi:hypothetical protein CVT25_007057 [Psilocybe cyanescens]|uniref:Chaperone DnaJ C-terminal domain-containing protein n=1 Tax=Psilocybe cyanescens TaxID=93625 RepID=A0A409WYA3_PSICY|nr:hypothetical protein CVT25_007057 [Psilocybe cyanescens]
MAAAYEVLVDEDMRSLYDSHGKDGLSRGGRSGPEMDAAEIFAQFFGGGHPSFGFDFGPDGPGKRRGTGQDSIIPHEVTLEDLYNGKSVKMNMEKEVVCTQDYSSNIFCIEALEHAEMLSPSLVQPVMVQVLRISKPGCKKCKGDKTIKEKTRQEIFIEKGMTDRQRIVLAGAGDQEPGVPAGDVIFVLKTASHESFERSGDDLLTHVTITLSEALLGFSRIILTHLDGRGVSLTTPRGKIIKPQDSIVIRREGMPVYKQPQEKGDLYVIFDIEMPNQEWLKSVDIKAVEAVLPPKRVDVDPLPEIVDEADFEESDIVDVRARSVPASQNFFDHGFASQFGEDDDDWEDEDEDEEDGDPYGHGPDCPTQ